MNPNFRNPGCRHTGCYGTKCRFNDAPQVPDSVTNRAVLPGGRPAPSPCPYFHDRICDCKRFVGECLEAA